MGEQRVSVVKEQEQLHNFVWHLLNDVQALEYMLTNDWFESGITRIGAEQEMCLVDNKTFKPATINMAVLEKLQGAPWCTTELAKFNLETNLTPRIFSGSSLREMEAENNQYLNIIRGHLKEFNACVALTGILPTLRKHDLDMSNLTPNDRYYALMESINNQLLGSAYELRLTGIDELLVKHDSPLLEACNTSFQVHLQVSPKDFVKMYNISQTLAAPTLAMAANSPIVFGRRLWHETRIALFQQALDTRTTHDHMRERSPRVHFGKQWLKQSILEIYKEDIARFRVLLGGDIEENSFDAIREGKAPRLRALQIHNSTVYRWNRPCYGISDNGKPHLRIENRVLPAGPTVLDSMANAAFWLGCMIGTAQEYDDITKYFSYADIRDNFGKAARYGIDTTFTWMKDKKISVTELTLKELLPLARKGLESQQIDKKDIDRYLDVIEGRAKEHTNGARWMLRAFTKLREQVGPDEATTVMTAAIVHNQAKEIPVHKWKLPEPGDLADYQASKLKVEEFMITDLFTVQKEDLIELVAELMDWRKIRYMPVEDSKGNLVGLVTSRLLLRFFTRRDATQDPYMRKGMVKDIMISEPITVSPDASIIEAMNKMREKGLGCLPVVQGKELVGIITEMDFLNITSRLLDRLEK